MRIEEFRTEYNTSSHIKPELPKSNLGHRGEAPSDIYWKLNVNINYE
ncbi:hypothetical protein HX062_14975 [Myroides sp. DF42-4-2]|nr:hypothetical protein [Myroides sp. DF42-4-2]